MVGKEITNMKNLIPALLLLLLPSTLLSQSVTLPAEVKGMRGAWIIVAPLKIDGGVPKWQWDTALQEVDLSSLLPPEFTKNMRGKVFTSQVDGKFWIRCWNAKGDIASDMATCWLVIGTPGPPIPIPPVVPIPDPKPPDIPIPLPSDKLGFVTLSRVEGNKLVPEAKVQALLLANNFEAISAKLAATSSMTVDQANAELRDRNKETLGTNGRTNWLSWFTAWGAKMDIVNAMGQTSRETYIQAYSETATGLKLVK